MAESPTMQSIRCPETLPWFPFERLTERGPVTIIAPHPDDESLGCGGLIARLTMANVPVRLVVLSDGAGSHRNSASFPVDRLRQLRQQEAIEAGQALGLSADDIVFLGLPDQFVPLPGTSGFNGAVSDCFQTMNVDDSVPSTVVVPWRRDRHCDHEASWQIARAAAERFVVPPLWLEYAVWLPELGDSAAWPVPDEVHPWRLDIGTVLDRKRAAIACHRSQTTDLIDDDPTGFRLTAETLSRFGVPWEIYLEARNDL